MTQERDAQAKTEIRDGMRIDWDAPIPMDDGIVLRADVFRPVSEGRYPVLLTYGPYAKGLAFQDGYPDAWETMARKHPDVVAGSTQPLPKLGSRGPGEMGAARLRLRARGQPRLRTLARLCRSLFAARDARFCRMHRLGRRTAVEQRQGRPQRHFVLRDQSVAGGVAAAAASWRRCASGKERRNGTAILRITAGFTARSGRTGMTCRSRPCSTGWERAGRAAARRAISCAGRKL